jgi:ParB-like chromosome segregation protein Spo0J
MEEDGITQPIVCVVDPDREGNFIIVDGEHRWRASKKIGYTEIPITIVPMTPEQARIATLRHNRARGSEDIELSTQVLRDLERLGAKGWALDSLMMSETEFDKLLEDISAPEALENEEFSQSWEPDMLDDADASAAERGDTSLRTVEGAQTLHTALTTAAVEAQRTREENLHAARTEEERSLIKRSNTLVRISLLFSEEEAEFVKRTLGTEAANKFLQILRWYTNGMPEGGR